jgi:ubiquinone/menaquinone biosynthesis C-methylase UbiE
MANTSFQLEGDAPQRYERNIVPMISSPMAEQMFEHVSLQDGDHVLDVACGTGIVTRVAAQRFPNVARIVGVDLNTRMLEVARENTPTTGVPLEWQQGDMCELPFPDRSFDVALCQRGIQFVPNKLAALREIRRALVSRGRFVFSVFAAPSPYHVKLSEALTRHVSAEAATSCLSPFSWRDEEVIRKLLDEAGFHGIEMRIMEFMIRFRASVDSVLGWIASAPYAREVAAVSEEARLAVGQEVVDALQPYLEGNDFVVPQEALLVQAQA